MFLKFLAWHLLICRAAWHTRLARLRCRDCSGCFINVTTESTTVNSDAALSRPHFCRMRGLVSAEMAPICQCGQMPSFTGTDTRLCSSRRTQPRWAACNHGRYCCCCRRRRDGPWRHWRSRGWRRRWHIRQRIVYIGSCRRRGHRCRLSHRRLCWKFRQSTGVLSQLQQRHRHRFAAALCIVLLGMMFLALHASAAETCCDTAQLSQRMHDPVTCRW